MLVVGVEPQLQVLDPSAGLEASANRQELKAAFGGRQRTGELELTVGVSLAGHELRAQEAAVDAHAQRFALGKHQWLQESVVRVDGQLVVIGADQDGQFGRQAFRPRVGQVHVGDGRLAVTPQLEQQPHPERLQVAEVLGLLLQPVALVGAVDLDEVHSERFVAASAAAARALDDTYELKGRCGRQRTAERAQYCDWNVGQRGDYAHWRRREQRIAAGR